MPYVVNKFDGTQLIVLEDGTLDITTTSLGLIGRNYTGFGEILNENFVFLLENFSNDSPPATPLKGQCWFNSDNGILNVYTGENWSPIGSASVSTDQPDFPSLGQLWIKLPEEVLFFYNGLTWQFIGPETAAGFGVTRARSTTLLGTDAVTYPVILLTIDDTVLGIITAGGFTIDPSNTVSGFVDLVPGINLLSGALVRSSLAGTASAAERLAVPRLINGVSFDGSTNINISSTTQNSLTAGSFITGETFNGSSARTWSVDASAVNQIGKIVARDSQGNFSAGTIFANFVGNLTGNVTAEEGISSFNVIEAKEFRGLNLSGNAFTATKLETARLINGVAFNGTSNITVSANAETLTGQFINSNVTTSNLTSVGTLVDLEIANAGLTVGNNLVKIFVDGNGDPNISAADSTNRNFKLTVADNVWNWLSPVSALSAGGDQVSTLSYEGNNKYNIGLPSKKFGKIYADSFIGNLSGTASQATASVTATRTSNIAGGGAGAIPYQSSQNNTVFLGAGTAGQFLTYSGSGPQWTDAPDSGVISIVPGTNIALSPTIGTGNVTVNVRASGSNQQIQYNNSGNIGASAELSWNNTAKILTVNQLKLENRTYSGETTAVLSAQDRVGLGVYNSSNESTAGVVLQSGSPSIFRKTGAGSVDLGSTAQPFNNFYLSGSFNWGGKNIPAPTTSTTTFLRNDGQWASVSAGSSVGGVNTQVQYNDNGSIAGNSAFTFNPGDTSFSSNTPLIKLGSVNVKEIASVPFVFSTSLLGLAVGNTSVQAGIVLDLNSSGTPTFRPTGASSVDLGKSGASANQFNDIWFNGNLRWNGKTISAPASDTTKFLRNDGTWAVPTVGSSGDPVSIDFGDYFIVDGVESGTLSGSGTVNLKNSVLITDTPQSISGQKTFTGGIISQAYNFTSTNNSIFHTVTDGANVVQVAVDGNFPHYFYKRRFVVEGNADPISGERVPSATIAGVDNGSSGGSGVAGVHTQAIGGLGVGVFASATNNAFTGAVFQGVTSRAKSNTFTGLRLYTSGNADPIFQVKGDGSIQADGAFSTPASDYAEYFEWADGNPNNEDRTGMTVSLIGDKIKIAESGEDVLGVVSAMPGVIGDAKEMEWQGKFLRDEFGRFITEPYHYFEWTDDQGTVKTEPSYGDLTKVPENAVRKDTDGFGNSLLRPKYNPEYDPSITYIPRSQRPEWAAVGLLGKLRVFKGQIIPGNWKKLKDINENIEEWLVK